MEFKRSLFELCSTMFSLETSVAVFSQVSQMTNSYCSLEHLHLVIKS